VLDVMLPSSAAGSLKMSFVPPPFEATTICCGEHGLGKNMLLSGWKDGIMLRPHTKHALSIDYR
jgi:hypothetical protein